MAGTKKIPRHHAPCGARLALIRYYATMRLAAQNKKTVKSLAIYYPFTV
jgi:hypothetical protein